jgi:hypothetical protein
MADRMTQRWVVWGVGAPPEPELADDPDDVPPEEDPNEIALTIARTRDPEWANDDGPTWVRLLAISEQDVDAFVADDENVRGYAEYLLGEDGTIPDTTPQVGVLRNDVVRRRPFDAARVDERGP